VRQRLDEESDDDHAHAGVAGGDPVGGPVRPDRASVRSDRVREWVEWFGVTRLVTSAIAVVVVCAGAWFLVRTPTPPSEASLPIAAPSDRSTTSATLLAPQTVATNTTLPPGPFVVHVAGAVVSPGVYELEPASRVDEAIRRAGGATSSADPGQLNLASLLSDGDRIYVPEVGEVVPPPVGPVGTSTEPGPRAPIDVNRADAGALDTLPGIGPATAAAIVTERDLNGPFASVEDLERVPGIGPAKLAALAGLVTA